MGDKKFDVVVFGSCMIDFLCYAPRLPNAGETIHGTQFEIGHGGKGANQCVAAAKLGASTALIARLGDDYFGRTYMEDLICNGVNVDNVTLTRNASSGVAQITISGEGENHIVIIAGANNGLSFEDAKKSGETLLKAKVVLFQLETSLDATIDTMKYISNHGGPIIIFNAAPAVADLSEDIYKMAHIFCVNESEAELLTGVKVTNVKQAFEALNQLILKGCNTAIITLGEQGSVYGGKELKPEHVPVECVKAVDTTGAGDAFLGALAYFVAFLPNISFDEKIKRASKVASQSVLNKGTQSSFPLKNSLPKSLFE